MQKKNLKICLAEFEENSTTSRKGTITSPSLKTGEEIIDENNMGYYAKTDTLYKFFCFSIGESKDESLSGVSNEFKNGWRIFETTTGEDGTVYITGNTNATQNNLRNIGYTNFYLLFLRNFLKKCKKNCWNTGKSKYNDVGSKLE